MFRKISKKYLIIFLIQGGFSNRSPRLLPSPESPCLESIQIVRGSFRSRSGLVLRIVSGAEKKHWFDAALFGRIGQMLRSTESRGACPPAKNGYPKRGLGCGAPQAKSEKF